MGAELVGAASFPTVKRKAVKRKAVDLAKSTAKMPETYDGARALGGVQRSYGCGTKTDEFTIYGFSSVLAPLVRNEKVAGSIPVGSTIQFRVGIPLFSLGKQGNFVLALPA